MSKKDLKIGIVPAGSPEYNKAIGEVVGSDTIKKTMKVEELELLEPNRGDTPLPAIQGDPAMKFAKEMREGELPPEAKGKILFVFHRETGQRLDQSLKLIMNNRKHAFQVWAKTYEYALELFIKRTKWKKRMGDIDCPIKED